MKRGAGDWITTFKEYSATYNTTPLFSEWSALWAVGTAVGRSVGMKAFGNLLSPNMFALLVGGPGTGKSQAIKAVRSVLVPAGIQSFIPASITRAGLEDYMVKNLQNRTLPDRTKFVSNECIALSEELQGILPEFDISQLTLYNILYDLPPVHIAQTRSAGEIRLEAPYCSILVGVQPSYLATTLPEQAWGMGFMSRSVLVFDTQRERTSMFENEEPDEDLRRSLTADYRHLASLVGYITWNQAAKKLYKIWWVDMGGPTVPEARRLAMGYNARREIHMAKLAMAYSLSDSDALIVTEVHVQKAIDLLLRTEDRMRHIFAEMSHTGTVNALGDLVEMVKRRAEGVLESEMINFLMERFPPTQVKSVLQNMQDSGLLRVDPAGRPETGFRRFLPGARLVKGSS